jgi:SAM-dependent methyltransferase
MADRRCQLCSATVSRVHDDGRRRFFHCGQCDLVFVPRQWHPSADAQKLRYEQHRNTIEDAGYVEMLGRSVSLLKEHGRDVRRVLDYGCGPTPVLVELLTRAGYEAVGYDPLFAAGADLPGPFDAVMCIETLEHFAEPRDELARIVGLLRPGGYLVIQTLFHPGPDRLADWWYARDATHVAFYSPRTLDWISGEFGLTLLHCDGKRIAVLQAAG